ncbi:UNVERIFIED_CONTAM: hypothetical protein IGO34_28610, partial [Salmonella enterica subsp. enterica serovar Weltevreden]
MVGPSVEYGRAVWSAMRSGGRGWRWRGLVCYGFNSYLCLILLGRKQIACCSRCGHAPGGHVLLQLRQQGPHGRVLAKRLLEPGVDAL